LSCDSINTVPKLVSTAVGRSVSWSPTRRALSSSTARTLARIADDETRHAALSWSIARWALSVLDSSARERVESAWRSAVEELVESSANDDVRSLPALGFPSRPQMRSMAEELRPLWTTRLAASN
jgi:diketogulonate reductase-like aldo/keto reductase